MLFAKHSRNPGGWREDSDLHEGLTSRTTSQLDVSELLTRVNGYNSYAIAWTRE